MLAMARPLLPTTDPTVRRARCSLRSAPGKKLNVAQARGAAAERTRLAGLTGIVSREVLEVAVRHRAPQGTAELNLKALAAGFEAAQHVRGIE